MIEFLPDKNVTGQTTKTAENARDQNGQGFELEVNWKPSSQLNLSASYSLQDSEDVQTHTQIPDAPAQQFKVNMNWEFVSNWQLNSQLDWIGDRKRAVGDVRPAIPNYTLLNFTLNRKNIFPDVDFSFAIRNAGDVDAREPSTGEIPNDYPLQSRSFWVGLNYTYK